MEQIQEDNDEMFNDTSTNWTDLSIFEETLGDNPEQTHYRFKHGQRVNITRRR